MKHLTLLSALMLTTISSSAQKNIDKAMNDLLNDKNVRKTITSNYNDNDSKGTATTYCHYAELFLTKKQQARIKKLEDAFDNDASAGYRFIHQTPELKAEQTNVSYGPNLEYLIQFCTKPKHNYRLLFTNDKANPNKRYVHAMVWYKENNGFRCLLYRIYGNNPAKKKKSITAKQSTTNEPKKVSTTTIVNGNEIRTITTDTNGKRVSVSSPINIGNKTNIDNDITFMRLFGNLRVAFLEAIKDSEQKALQTGIVMNMLELCQKHSKHLSDNEANTCKLSIIEMQRILKKTNPDTFLEGMLEEARLELE
ncbi:MAG: hypothetical protein NC344_08940 [Bacteroidales bacterium]|nr:hypothetical protein [Bacteroidales bacterium]MCM1147934.1 hypothetical protein [Bacteroidales bacterium]MCM1205483.1 hypothetical protein [Bacillota bacterium]MCM1509255.1 hypothetical protein [Clostridium sp.]